MAAAGHSAVKGRQFRFASPLGNDPDRNFSTCEPNKTLFRLLGSSFLHVNSPLHFLRYVYSVLYCTMLFVCLFVSGCMISVLTYALARAGTVIPELLPWQQDINWRTGLNTLWLFHRDTLSESKYVFVNPLL